MATRPSPPGLFSITTGWPHFLVSRSANSRPPISVPLPGPSVTMKRTLRVGQFCAEAGAAARSGASRAITARASSEKGARRMKTSKLDDCGDHRRSSRGRECDKKEWALPHIDFGAEAPKDASETRQHEECHGKEASPTHRHRP